MELVLLAWLGHAFSIEFVPVVALAVRQDCLYKDFFESVPHENHHAIVVTANIKHGEGRHVISRIKKFAYVIEVFEFSVLDK